MTAYPSPRRPVVLLVEDEPLLRMVTAEALLESGFDVVGVGDADAAVDILETNTGISLVFTDIEMAGSMNGLELLQVVHDRWPPVRLFVTSGRRGPPSDRMPFGARFFSKPYDISAVVSAFQESTGLHS